MGLIGLLDLKARRGRDVGGAILPLGTAAGSLVFGASMFAGRHGAVIDRRAQTVTTRGRTFFRPAWERHYRLDDFDGVEEQIIKLWGWPLGPRKIRLVGLGHGVDLVDPRSGGVELVRPRHTGKAGADLAQLVSSFCGLPCRIS